MRQIQIYPLFRSPLICLGVLASLLLCPLNPVSGAAVEITNASGSIVISRNLTPEMRAEWAHFLTRHPGQWTLTVDSRGFLSAASVSEGEYFPQIDHSTFQAWLRPEMHLLGVDEQTLDSLVLSAGKTTPGGTYYTFQATLAGVEVFDSTLDLKIGKNGQLLGIINHLRAYCSPSNLESFTPTRALANLSQRYPYQILGDKGTVIFSHNKTCQLVLKCYLLMPRQGYQQPVETFCLVNDLGEIVFRKTLTVPYRMDAR